MKFYLIALAALVTFQTSAFAGSISDETAKSYVQKTLNISKSSARDFNNLMDSSVWTQNTMHFFDANSSQEKEQIFGAVQAYLANAIRSATDLPNTMREGKLNSILAQIFLSDSEIAAIRNAPITFKIRNIQDVSERGSVTGARITVQLLPEYTKADDTTARVTIVLRKTGSSYKVTEIESNGLRFVALYTVQVKQLGRDVSTAIQTLLDKKLIERSQIEEYSRLK